MPPIPTWETAHPIVVHFPIGALLLAPLLMVLALVIRAHERGLQIGAFALMVVGSVAAWIAVATGQASAAMGVVPPEAGEVLTRHAQLAENVKLYFTFMTIGYGGLSFVPPLANRPIPTKVAVALQIAFLVAHIGGCLMLVNASHAGGRLVHEFGTAAWM